MSHIQLRDGIVLHANEPLLCGLASELEAEADPSGTGLFLRAKLGRPRARAKLGLGQPQGVQRFTACHRYEPFWMEAKAGQSIAAVPVETQSLLLELEGGRVALLVPLVDKPLRASLEGKADALSLVLETGDAYAPISSALALFVAVGEDPYELIPRAAAAVAARLGTGRLRVEKPLPDFADWFGWCTWDAFYQEVSHEKVREGLLAFAKGGVTPKLLILDDGWQSEHQVPTGERRLTAFRANGKFEGTLSPTVRMAKDEFGVQIFMVWHAFHGYWGGVDGSTLSAYGVRDARRSYSPGILSYVPAFNEEYWGPVVGARSSAEHWPLLSRLSCASRVGGSRRRQGRQPGFERGLGSGQRRARGVDARLSRSAGGLSARALRRPPHQLHVELQRDDLQRSRLHHHAHLDGFLAKRPETHGAHLYTNAQVGVWFGEFVHPDWDMFQSAHAMGGYHAMGRAVSGSPVYVSDKPGEHDFEVLSKLTVADGSSLRANHVGRPTRDCLFHDPTSEDVLLKIFNLNLEAGVVGVFNARHREKKGVISGQVSPRDVSGLAGSEFAVYSHNGKKLVRLQREASVAVDLEDLSAEIFTIVPIDRGLAPIGLCDKFNSAAALSDKRWDGATFVVTVRDRGRFLAYSERRPATVMVDGAPVPFAYDEAGALAVDLQKTGSQIVRIGF